MVFTRHTSAANADLQRGPERLVMLDICPTSLNLALASPFIYVASES